MEFEGEDQRALSGLVRTLSGRIDFLMEGDRGGSGATVAEEARPGSISEDVSTEVTEIWKANAEESKESFIR